jgi:hypothetical protein
MKRKCILTLLLIFSLYPFAHVYAQNRKFEAQLSIGNNGQLDNLLYEFYYPGYQTSFFHDATSSKSNYLKYNASLKYYFREKVSLCLKTGFSYRNDKFIQDEPTEYNTTESRQRIFNISPSLNFSVPLEKLELSTGIELPIFFVSPYDFKMHTIQKPDSVNITSETKATINITGGFVWGVNNYWEIKYFFAKNFFFSGGITYGVLWANLGRSATYTSEFILPNQPTNTFIVNKQWKKCFFSPPELALGIGIKI